jgi:hypothetical protein
MRWEGFWAAKKRNRKLESLSVEGRNPEGIPSFVIFDVSELPSKEGNDPVRFYRTQPTRLRLSEIDPQSNYSRQQEQAERNVDAMLGCGLQHGLALWRTDWDRIHLLSHSRKRQAC